MDRFWHSATGIVLRVANWLLCPDRPLEEVSDLPESREEIAAALALKDSRKIDEALTYCKDLFDREEERTRTLESKAITLTSFAGLTAAFVSGFAGLLLDSEKIPCWPARAVLLLPYIAIVCAFARTILCALRVVKVGDPYRFAAPAPTDILNLSIDTPQGVRLERAVDFFYAYRTNLVINNNKASYLMSAQRGFATAMFFLLLTTIVSGGYALLTG